MILGYDFRLFFDNISSFYQTLPNEGKLILYIVLILIFIACILLIIMLEQRRLNRKIINKKIEASDDTEILDLDFDSEIDETNEKTRNLKEITDKIQAAIDNKAIDLTKFEKDQEANSIISYGELIKSVGKPVVDEQPEQPFSLPNLVRKIEVDEEIEKEQPYRPTDNLQKDGKFKSSVFISPVFGIQNQNQQILTEQPTPQVMTQAPAAQQEDFVEEEAFLNNLINFRKNLD